MTADERALVEKQRQLLAETRKLLSDLDMLPEDLRALDGIQEALEELFLLVVVGEYNAGKSTLINCLLGERALESGDLPTTREVHLLKYGKVRSTHQVEDGLLHHHLPAELLRDLSIVDTPGTNSMQRREQELTERFVPRADLVLFLTTLVRPYTASEHDFLRLIRSWGKKILFVVNHADVARKADQIERVREYVLEQAKRELGEEPPIFVISALQALEGTGAASRTVGESGEETHATRMDVPPASALPNEYEALEEHLRDTLGARERVTLKLRSPLDTLRTVLTRQKEALAERLRLVEGDLAAMGAILKDVAAYESRMTGELSRYQAKIENVLLQLERRGHRVLDDLVRLANLMRLRDPDVVENRFRNEVVADTGERIEEEVNALIDWLVRENLAAWNRAHEELEQRRRALRQSATETRFVSREYVYNREEIFRNLAGPVKRHLESFSAREEADRIVAAVNHAVARTFGMEALVVGFGAMLTAAFTSLTIDVTGTLGGTILLIAGLFLLPARRARLKRELSTKLQILRTELDESVQSCFGEEVRRYAGALRAVFEPERDAVDARLASLREAGERLEALKGRRVELSEAVEGAREVNGR